MKEHLSALNRKQVIVAICLFASAIALFIAGTKTFALWHDAEDISAFNVTSGNLDVAVIDKDSGWWDVSKDVSGNPKKIDMETFRTVPGDELQYRAAFDVALEGDNLKADLKITSDADVAGDLAGNDTTDTKRVKFTYAIYKANAAGEIEGDAVVTGDGITGTTVTEAVTLTPTDVNRKVIADGDKANYIAVVNVVFDKDTPNRELVQKTAQLSSMKVNLTQHRD